MVYNRLDNANVFVKFSLESETFYLKGGWILKAPESLTTKFRPNMFIGWDGDRAAETAPQTLYTIQFLNFWGIA